MKEQIENIQKIAKEAIGNVKNSQELEEARVKFLGKKSELTSVLRGMKDLSNEERPIIGNLVNQVKEEIEKTIKEKEETFKAKELEKKLNDEKIDYFTRFKN